MRKRSTLFLIVLLSACSPMSKSPSSIQERSSRQSVSSDCPLKFEKVSFCAQLARIDKINSVGKPLSFKLAFWSRDSGNFLGPYADPGLIPKARLWMVMPSGSHGAAPVTVSQSLNATGDAQGGIYDVKQVIYSMSPRNDEEWWEIYIELRLQDGTVVDEAKQIIWDNFGA